MAVGTSQSGHGSAEGRRNGPARGHSPAHVSPSPSVNGITERKGKELREQRLTQTGGTSFCAWLGLARAAPAKTRTAQWGLGVYGGTMHQHVASYCSQEGRTATYFPFDFMWPVGDVFTLWIKVLRTLRHL